LRKEEESVRRFEAHEERHMQEGIGSMPIDCMKHSSLEEEMIERTIQLTPRMKPRLLLHAKGSKNRSAPCRLIRCKQSNDKEEEDRDSITGRSTETTEALRITGVPTLHKRVDL